MDDISVLINVHKLADIINDPAHEDEAYSLAVKLFNHEQLAMRATRHFCKDGAVYGIFHNRRRYEQYINITHTVSQSTIVVLRVIIYLRPEFPNENIYAFHCIGQLHKSFAKYVVDFDTCTREKAIGIIPHMEDRPKDIIAMATRLNLDDDRDVLTTLCRIEITAEIAEYLANVAYIRSPKNVMYNDYSVRFYRYLYKFQPNHPILVNAPANILRRLHIYLPDMIIGCIEENSG